MQPKTKSNSSPPKWWLNVITDIEKSVIASRKSFVEPNTVLSNKMDDDGNIVGYYIRQQNAKIGYYSSKQFKSEIPIGVVIKGTLPKPQTTDKEMTISSFIIGTIHSNVPMVPIMWLTGIVRKIIEGEPIKFPEDFREFPDWVSLNIELKRDKQLIDLLYRVTRYEGLKGLSRFNDLAK